MNPGIFPLSHEVRAGRVHLLGPVTLDASANSSTFEFAVHSSPIIDARFHLVCLIPDNAYVGGECAPFDQFVHDGTSNMDGRPTWTVRWQGQTVYLVVFHNGAQAKILDALAGSAAALTLESWAIQGYALTA
jgi:hypothetical protein